MRLTVTELHLAESLLQVVVVVAMRTSTVLCCCIYRLRVGGWWLEVLKGHLVLGKESLERPLQSLRDKHQPPEPRLSLIFVSGMTPGMETTNNKQKWAD